MLLDNDRCDNDKTNGEGTENRKSTSTNDIADVTKNDTTTTECGIKNGDIATAIRPTSTTTVRIVTVMKTMPYSDWEQRFLSTLDH